MIRRRKPPHELEPSLDMSSLIDVSFLLLVFFLVTSTLDPKESDLAMTLPTDRSTGTLVDFDMDPIEVDVESSGNIILNGELLDTGSDSRELPMLLDRLKTYAATASLTNSPTMVIISADDATKGQRFVDVLNALADRDVGIHQISIRGFGRE